jgi:hypothetical protein
LAQSAPSSELEAQKTSSNTEATDARTRATPLGAAAVSVREAVGNTDVEHAVGVVLDTCPAFDESALRRALAVHGAAYVLANVAHERRKAQRAGRAVLPEHVGAALKHNRAGAAAAAERAAAERKARRAAEHAERFERPSTGAATGEAWQRQRAAEARAAREALEARERENVQRRKVIDAIDPDAKRAAADRLAAELRAAHARGALVQRDALALAVCDMRGVGALWESSGHHEVLITYVRAWLAARIRGDAPITTESRP